MVSFKYLLLSVGFSRVIDVKRIKSALGKVQFDLSCNGTVQACGNVAKVLNIVGECLGNVIEFKEPILAEVKYYSFCGPSKPDCTSIVGQGWSSDVEVGGKYDYPQPLAKQLGIDRSQLKRFDFYDIRMALNAGLEYHIAGNVEYTSQETSLMNLVAHEMSHALGISASYGWLHGDTLAMPYHRDENGKVQFTQNLFCSHLYIRETNKPLSSYIDKLNNLPTIHASDNVTDALLHPPYIDTIKELSSLFTIPNSTYFKTNKNSSVTVMTAFKNFMIGSTLTHLDAAYSGSRDSMMIPFSEEGTGIDSMERYSDWSTAPYGPLTLEIFETLGYKLNKQPKWGHSLGGQIQLIREEGMEKMGKHKVDFPIPAARFTDNVINTDLLSDAD